MDILVAINIDKEIYAARDRTNTGGIGINVVGVGINIARNRT